MVASIFRHFSRLKLFEVFLGSESCGMSSTTYCLLLEVVIELLWTQHVVAARQESTNIRGPFGGGWANERVSDFGHVREQQSTRWSRDDRILFYRARKWPEGVI